MANRVSVQGGDGEEGSGGGEGPEGGSNSGAILGLVGPLISSSSAGGQGNTEEVSFQHLC